MGEVLKNLPNALGYGGITAVIGMLIVFTGLIILIFAVKAMAKVFEMLSKKKEAKENAALEEARLAAQKAAEPVPEVITPQAEEINPQDDPQLIAAIAAALAVYTDSGKALVVRRVRRVPGWRAAARSEMLG